MRKAAAFTICFLMALALATAAAATPPVPTRRSRFLANKLPSSYYDCKKRPAVCGEPGSPGPTCCKGTCVDTQYDDHHCGKSCRACKHGKKCCAGECVDLLTDNDNCGECGVSCGGNDDCYFGVCNYAG